MTDVHVLAEYEKTTRLAGCALLVAVEALGAMFLGGVHGFAPTYGACLIPDLDACCVIDRDDVRLVMRALGELEVEYDRDVVVTDAGFEPHGRRRIHPSRPSGLSSGDAGAGRKRALYRLGARHRAPHHIPSSVPTTGSEGPRWRGSILPMTAAHLPKSCSVEPRSG
jgi:hypothetical protein